MLTSHVIPCIHPKFRDKGLTFDLNEFWNGAPEKKTGKAAYHWLGAFSGRPGLADELFPTLKAYFANLSPKKIRTLLTDIRQLFRFLDAYESWIATQTDAASTPRIDSVNHITILHGLRWITPPPHGGWASAKVTSYSNVVKLITYTRARLGFSMVAMPSAPSRDPIRRSDVPTEKQGKSLIIELSRRAKSIWNRWARADELASSGRNLLAIPRNPHMNKTPWNFELTEADAHATYRALIKETGEPLISLKYFMSRLGYSTKELPECWPKHPQGHPRAGNTVGWLDLQSGLYPNSEDISVLVLLFMARSGWNQTTAYALDVSSDDTWHAQYSDKLVWLYSYKGRGNSWQDTLAWLKQRTGCYQIVHRLLERTEPLRSLVEREPGRCNLPSLSTQSPWLTAGQNSTVPSVTVLNESSNGITSVRL